MKRLSILILAVTGIFLLSRCGSTNSKTKYQISVSAVPGNGGSVSPTGGKYEEGKKLDISATPTDSSWQFDNWSGDYQGLSSSATITVNKAKNIKAHFSKKNFDLTVNTQGEGTVDQKVVETSSANGYGIGTTVELTAKPDTGWTFIKWKGDLSTDENPTQITVDKAKKVTAVFEKKSYQLTVNTKGQGAVNQKVLQASAAANYDYDTTVQLTANPSKGWKFVKWTGDLNGSENPDQITIDHPKEVTAVFKKKSFAITVNIDGKGSINRDPDQNTYKYKTSVQLSAKPAQGWKFVKWTGDISTSDNPISVTIDANKTVTAVFERKSYNLTINTDGEGQVSKDIVDGSSTTDGYLYESVVKLTATPNSGWSFIEWTGDIVGTQVSNNIVIDTDKTVTAKFAKPPSSVINEVSRIYADSATIFGEVTKLGNAVLQEKGVCYSTSELPTLDDKCAKVESESSIEYRLEGLNPGTTYYVRIYGTNEAGTDFSKQVVFDTKYFNPGNGVTDIDGNKYETIIIGDQEWIRENLRVTRYQNGDAIPHLVDDSEWSSATSGAYSYFDNDQSRNIPYGKLYNWFTTTDSRGLCPEGWKVPSRTDWNELIWYLGGEDIAGERMKFPGDWSTQTNDTTSVSGFKGLKNGSRQSNGSFNVSATVSANWWSSTEYDDLDARYYYIYYANSKAMGSSTRKRRGQAIRCVRNIP